MAPSFLRDLRRRSRASFKTESSNGSAKNDEKLSESSSTLNITFGGDRTPPIQKIAEELETHSNSIGPDNVPPGTTIPNKRYSVGGMAGLGSPPRTASLPISQYAPRIANIQEGAWVRPSS